MCSVNYPHESLIMGSELIVLSSDDDDDDDDVLTQRAAKLHKRSKVLVDDNEVTVIERASLCLESKAIEKCASLSTLERKPPSDDDCCILNYDPENDVQVPDFQANDADDLVVVGERGPVACRDFPHARHLCVKFPFTTTSHEKYCEQCHCYVCDVIAPCLLWGQGKQSNDHCHAFDKDEKWKKMRSHARSVSMKLAAPLPAPNRRRQMIQPQRRTYVQPPLRVRSTTGFMSPTNHSNSSAHVASANQYWSSSPGNWSSCLPSKMGRMLANGSHGNRASVGGMNMSCPGNPHLDINVVSPANNRRRTPHEQRSFVPYSGPTSSCASQQISYMPSLHATPNHSARGSTQMCFPRPGAAYSANFVDMPLQQYQDQGVVVPSVTACNNVEGINGSGQSLPRISNLSTLSRIGMDLVTLQGFLMQGITGQSQDQSTAHGVSTVETWCTQSSACASGSSMVNGPSKMSLNRDVESLYNPFEPSEMASCNVIGIENKSSRFASIQASVQTSKNDESMTELVGVSMNTAEKSLCPGGGNDATSSLDQLLAAFDDDFWTLLEPTLHAV